MTAAPRQPSQISMIRTLGDVGDERLRQHARWGQQDHPDLPPGLVGKPRRDVFDYLGLRFPEAYQADVDGHAAVGESNYALIALEELSEAVEAAAAGDDAALRLELVQAAAVLVQWVEAIDRRRAGVTS